MSSESLSPDHAGDTLLAAYLDRKLGDEERDRLEGHLAECDPCRGRLLAATGTLRGERRRKRALTAAGAAAGALVIAGLFLGLPSSPTPWSPQLRGGPMDGFVTPSGLEAVHPPEGTTVRVGSDPLVWRSVEGVARYRLTVSDPEGTVLFEEDVADTVVSLQSLGALVPGEIYVWYVDALLPDGRSITTGVQSFVVRP